MCCKGDSFMLFFVSTAIFIVSLSVLLLLLFFYRKEIAEDGFSFFTSKEKKPVREMGVKGTILHDDVPADNIAKQRLINASSSANMKSSSVKRKTGNAGASSRNDQNAVSMNLVKTSIELLNQYLWECRDRLKYFDGPSLQLNAITTKNTADHIIFARKLVQALQRRVEFLESELKTESPDYQKIYNEITSPVTFIEDTFHSLISTEETPPVKWDDLGMIVKKITSELDTAIRERKRSSR
jgi:hypothetical protein